MAGSVHKEGSTWYYMLEMKVNGKRKQPKKRGFKTKRDALRGLTEAQNALNNGTYIEPSRLLFSDYITNWINNRKHNLSPQTFVMNMIFIKKHILPFLGDTQITDIRATHLNNFITELVAKGLASSTVKKIFNILNTSLNDAVRLQVISKNFATLIDKPRVQQKELQVWDSEIVLKFLEASKTSRYSIVFHLALMTGMRQGEILGLRWTDIDFDNKKLSVRQTLSHDGKTIISGAKTSSSIRSIALDEGTIKILKKHRLKVLEEKALAVVYHDYDLVVCSQYGTPVPPRNILRVHKQIIRSASLPPITFHDLRHTHASLLLRENVHPKVVSERLGHSKIQLTLDTYSHLLPNMQHEAAQQLERMFLKTRQNM